MSALKKLLVKRFLPFLFWLPELKDGKVLRADLIAGITVALVLIPQSMAYAQLAGLPAYYGLYAAFMPPMIASLFGSSRQLATGPVAVVSLMTAAALEPLATAGSASYIAYAIILSLTVGLFQLALGLLRLGVLVNFLSHPVVVGFTNAAAIIIATSQLSKIFGVSVEKMERHYETVWNVVIAALDGTHWPTFLMAVLAFSIMIGLRKINPRLPSVLIAVAVTTVLAWGIDFQKLQNVEAGQIASPVVQQSIQVQLAMQAQLQALNEAIVVADQAYAQSINEHGPNSVNTLQARFKVENIKLQRDQLKNDLKTGMKTLQSEPLYFVAAQGSAVSYSHPDDPHLSHQAGQLYTQAEVPAGADAQPWNLHKINANGGLIIHSGGKVVGVIPSGLPSFKMPSFDLSMILQLLSTAIVISLIGFMEAISIAKAMAAKTRQKLDANQELIGQGLGNIMGGLFQSYPTSGSFSRSAVNISAGAITGFSAVVTSIMVIITLLWLTPLLYYLPQATLAAVIMMAVIGLVNIEPIKHAWHASKHDGAVSVITFVLTLAFAPHLDKGIMIGVLLSLGLFLYRRMAPRVVFMRRTDDGKFETLESCQNCTEESVGIVRFEGSLYFANISFFEERVQQLLANCPKLRYLVIEAVSINEIDASGEEILRATAQRLKDLGIEMLFSRVKTPVKQVLEHTGFVAMHGEDKFFRQPEFAFDYIAVKQHQA